MIKTVALLYKQSKKDSTQSWEIQVKVISTRTIPGAVGGKLTIGSWTICNGKNIGRANETTPEEQALAGAEAKATKKRESGYGNNITIKNTAKFFEPMLAKEWKDLKDKLSYPVAVQPKLDGCVSYDTLISTNIGDLKIGEIVENSIECDVMAFNEKTRKIEYKSIKNRMKNGIDIDGSVTQWYEIELENGKTLKVTGNHLVYLPKLKCWRRVDELDKSDILLNNF